jgi:hypothetical protein
LDQQRSGNVGVNSAAVLQENLEIILPCRIIVLQGVSEGLFFGDGEMIGVFDTQLLAKLYQVINRLVRTFGASQNLVVDDKVIAGTVTDQHITVAVMDGATGSLDIGPGGVSCGVIYDTAGFIDLLIV